MAHYRARSKTPLLPSTALYCSDECRLADLSASRGIIDSDYNPDRQSPPPPPVSHNSFSFLAFPASQVSESDSSGSTDSSLEFIDTDHCHACLASLYGYPPLQPCSCLLHKPEQKVEPSKQHQLDIMMAAQMVEANLCKETPRTERPFAGPSSLRPTL